MGPEGDARQLPMGTAQSGRCSPSARAERSPTAKLTMTDPTGQRSNEDPSETVSTTVTATDIAVEKVATVRGKEAVVVHLEIKSSRNEACDILVGDPLPEPFRNNTVEFHPEYDPEHWTRKDDAVVYQATLEPGANRTTVYGVVTDGPPQLDKFAVDPVIEVDSFGGIFEHWADDGTDTSAGSASTSAPEESVATDSPSQDTNSSAPAVDGDEGHAVAALIAELNRRDLTRPEKSTIREAIGLEDVTDTEAQLTALQSEIEDLAEAIDAAEQEGQRIDRLELKLDSMVEQFDTLAEDVATLQETVEGEVDWRANLRDMLTDLDDPPSHSDI